MDRHQILNFFGSLIQHSAAQHEFWNDDYMRSNKQSKMNECFWTDILLRFVLSLLLSDGFGYIHTRNSGFGVLDDPKNNGLKTVVEQKCFFFVCLIFYMSNLMILERDRQCIICRHISKRNHKKGQCKISTFSCTYCNFGWLVLKHIFLEILYWGLKGDLNFF